MKKLLIKFPLVLEIIEPEEMKDLTLLDKHVIIAIPVEACEIINDDDCNAEINGGT